MKRFAIAAAAFLAFLSFIQPGKGRSWPLLLVEKGAGWKEKSLKGIFRKAYYSRDDGCRIYLFRKEKTLLILTQEPTSNNQILKEGIQIGINEENESIFRINYYTIDENGEKSIALKKRPDLFRKYVEQTEKVEGLPREIKATLAYLCNLK
jgi:hypothetical protein